MSSTVQGGGGASDFFQIQVSQNFRYANKEIEKASSRAKGASIPGRRPYLVPTRAWGVVLGMTRASIGLMVCHYPRSEKDAGQTRALALIYPALDIGPGQSVFALHDRLTATFR